MTTKETEAMNAPLSLQTMQQQGGAVATLPDQAVDMFTERGFALAQRIANAFASSDAVPAQFRTYNLKKVGREEKWVENTSALGNCLVAIEVARAVRMSIIAVMQNADMIEGKLRWSGKFVIAAINASGRFTPLRFDMKNKGPLKAKYKEKTGWDDQARRPIFTEREVDIENIECIAWAIPKGVAVPAGVYTLAQAEQAGLPVVKSAKVSMKMVVEEGWYAKAGSKWQTEMAELMFQYRAGSFFGNIHAPDVVMGMTRTAEEERDLAGETFDVAPDGTATPVPVSELRGAPARAAAPLAEEVPAAEQHPARGAQQHQPEQAQRADQQQPAFDGDAYADQIEKASTPDAVNRLVRDIPQGVSEDLRDVLMNVAERRIAALVPPEEQEPRPATGRRARSNVSAPE